MGTNRMRKNPNELEKVFTTHASAGGVYKNTKNSM